jgi:hypothetical protein
MAGLAPRSWAADVAASRTGPDPEPDATPRVASGSSVRHDVELIGLLMAIATVVLALTVTLGVAPMP